MQRRSTEDLSISVIISWGSGAVSTQTDLGLLPEYFTSEGFFQVDNYSSVDSEVEPPTVSGWS